MKMPTYEQQNEFLRKYVAPLFEFNLAKVLRNYRMNKAGPFRDERMAQIRSDVLAEIKEKDEKYSNHISEHAYKQEGEKVREVRKSSPNLADLCVCFVSDLPLKERFQEFLGLNLPSASGVHNANYIVASFKEAQIEKEHKR